MVVAEYSEGMFSDGDSIGERGKLAKKIGEDAFKSFYEWFSSGAYLDVHAGEYDMSLEINKLLEIEKEAKNRIKKARVEAEKIISEAKKKANEIIRSIHGKILIYQVKQ